MIMGLIWLEYIYGIWLNLYIYTLWLFNIAMENCLLIDGLPIKNGGSFHGYVKKPEGIFYLVWQLLLHLCHILSPS